MWYTIHIPQCIFYSWQFTVHSGQLLVYTSHLTGHRGHFTSASAQLTVTAYCAQGTVNLWTIKYESGHSTVYNWHGIVDITQLKVDCELLTKAHKTLNSAQLIVQSYHYTAYSAQQCKVEIEYLTVHSWPLTVDGAHLTVPILQLTVHTSDWQGTLDGPLFAVLTSDTIQVIGFL